MTITATMDDVTNWAFPHRLYQSADFPGLLRCPPPEQAGALVGKRYELGADEPDAYDCPGLLLHCQRNYWGKALPNLTMGHEMRDLFADQLASEGGSR